MKRPAQVLLTLFALVLLSAAEAQAQRGMDIYLRYNLHVFERDGRLLAFYSGWISPGPGHSIVPYNSRVNIREGGQGMLIRLPDGRTVDFDWEQRRMNMTLEQYVGMIGSPTPVSYPELSKLDLSGVAKGVAYVGMSKQGVLVALGIPPSHKTPSLEGNVWLYWKNRHRKLAVEFDSYGIVARIRD